MLNKSPRVFLTLESCRFFSHKPVMVHEIVQALRPDHGKVYIDMTFGAGGHTRQLLASNKSIKVVTVDRDLVAYRAAQELAKEVAIKSERLNIKQSIIPIHGKFSQVFRDIHLSGIPYGSVNGVIFDLGASSMQYDNPERGFSINKSGPLDMRMDTSNESDITAEDVVNNMSQENLALMFKILGEERRSRKVANAIVDARTLLGRIKTTGELSKIINSSSMMSLDALGRYADAGTKVFQALRIFVNNELNEFNYAIDKIREFLIPADIKDDDSKLDDKDLLNLPHGLAAVLTFHSLEDRIAKRHFSGVDVNEPPIRFLSQHDRIRTNFSVIEMNSDGNSSKNLKKWRPILKHVKRPTDAEIAANPRSRSAKLRLAVRLT